MKKVGNPLISKMSYPSVGFLDYGNILGKQGFLFLQENLTDMGALLTDI